MSTSCNTDIKHVFTTIEYSEKDRTLLESVSFDIFTSTWNMGEGEPPNHEELRNWIVKGYQIYAIAIQECMHLELLLENLQ